MYLSILAYLLAVLSCCFCQEKIFPAVKHDACPSAEERAAIREQITERVVAILNNSSQPPCACGGPEWTRIAHLDMSDPSQQCPSNWKLISAPIRGCGHPRAGVCGSAVFASSGLSYSCVCGRIIAYQRGTPNAFFNIYVGTPDLEGRYVEGISLTHGAAGSRQHIWTFAAAWYEGISSRSTCPCTNADEPWPYEVPQFVGDDYFCDTGNPGPGSSHTTVYVDDPLWDGEGCGPTSTCCEFNNPPWFCTTLPQPTTDDIELRICLDSNDEDVLVNLVDVYVM